MYHLMYWHRPQAMLFILQVSFRKSKSLILWFLLRKQDYKCKVSLVLLKPEIYIFSKASVSNCPLLFFRQSTSGGPGSKAQFWLTLHSFLVSLSSLSVFCLCSSHPHAIQWEDVHHMLMFFLPTVHLEMWSKVKVLCVLLFFFLWLLHLRHRHRKDYEEWEGNGMALHRLFSFTLPFNWLSTHISPSPISSWMFLALM